MTTSESQRPEDDLVQQLFSEAADRAAVSHRLAQHIAKGARLKFERALDIRTEIISSSYEHIHAQKNAAILSGRHDEYYIGSRFVNALRKLKADPADQVAWAELQALQEMANSGFFVMKYSDQMMLERLQSPSYVIAQAYGRHPDSSNGLHRTEIASADCQCFIPDAVMSPSETIEFPIEGRDIIYKKNVVREWTEKPWAIGEVKDIAANHAMNDLKLAGAARRTAFHHIETVINPQRGEFPIEYMAATIGQLNGIVLPNGERVMLNDFKILHGIQNERSLTIHTGSAAYPAKHVYTLVEREVPVEIDGEIYLILVDWFVMSHLLKNQQA
jgi:hypothetical protein